MAKRVYDCCDPRNPDYGKLAKAHRVHLERWRARPAAARTDAHTDEGGNVKTVVHLSANEACDLIAAALKQRTGKDYDVKAFCSSGYGSGNAFDHAPASVRFEATERPAASEPRASKAGG